MNEGKPSCSDAPLIHALFHPDYTVGSGITPDLLTLHQCDEAARGLMKFLSHTAGGESHPALRTEGTIASRNAGNNACSDWIIGEEPGFYRRRSA